MINLSNSLSFIRAPLALLFLQQNIPLRITAIILAMFTDSIDGYVARRSKCVTKFGTILDPAMDKFFVYFLLSVFFIEGKIDLLQAFAIISRDFFLCLFGLYLLLINNWKNFQIRAIRWGKVTTALQFCVLIGLTMNLVFSWFIYSLFIAFGLMAFIELLQAKPLEKKANCYDSKSPDLN